MLVIADAARAQAVAGVMGGGRSRSRRGTTADRVRERVLRAARRSAARSKRLGLKTEASYRFERGADIERAARRARPRVRAARADRRGHAAPGLVSTPIPAPRAPRRRPARGATGSRGCSASTVARRGRRAHPRGPRFDVSARRAAGDVTVPTLARRRGARGRPHRGGRAPPRLRPPADRRSRRSRDVPARPDAAPRARALVRRVAGRRRVHRSRHLLVHRRPTPPRRSPTAPRRPVAIANPLSREVRGAAAVAAARPGRRVGAQPAARTGATCACSRSARCFAGRRRDADRHRPSPGTGAGAPEHWSGGERDGRLLRHEGRRRAPGAARSACALTFAPAAVAPTSCRAVPPPSSRVRRAARRSASSASSRPASPTRAACRRARRGVRRRTRPRRRRAARAARRDAAGRGRCRGIPSVVRDLSIVVDDTLPAATFVARFARLGARDARARARVRPLPGQGRAGRPGEPVVPA